MWDQDTQIVREYAESAFRRFRQPMEPVGHRPNWADQPSRYKTYPDAPLVPLPDGPRVAGPPRTARDRPGAPSGIERSLAEICVAPSPPTRRRYTLERLAWLLRLSYGVLDRRMRVDWNHEDADGYPAARWGRGTPSGGGLYPLEIYWVAGAGGPVQPGIYHYATGHHALERLALGNFTGQVCAALHGQPDAARTDQFLLVSARFWKNSFKYASLGYHLATQDLGALLGSWDLLGAGLGLATRRVLWFDDETLNRMLGLDTADESVLAVVPLPWAGGPASPGEAAPVGAVDLPAYERSRNVNRFPLADRVHRASLVGTQLRPGPVSARAAAARDADAAGRCPSDPRDGRGIALPPPLTDRLTEPVGALLARRRSSSGGFSAIPPLDPAQLATVISVASRARHYRCDLKPDDEPVGWTRLSVLANHITGIPAGCYRYDATGHSLRLVEPGFPDGRVSDFLLGCHVLTNYAPEQVAAVLVISGRLDAMLSSYRGRGYRMLNAEAGTVAQAGYVATTALGVGCGAVLGIDNVAVDEVLGFAGTDERSLLFLLIGRERPWRPGLDLRLELGGDA